MCFQSIGEGVAIDSDGDDLLQGRQGSETLDSFLLVALKKSMPLNDDVHGETQEHAWVPPLRSSFGLAPLIYEMTGVAERRTGRA